MIFDKIASLLGGATSQAAGGILTGITNSVNSIFDTASDKEKSKEFESAAQQTIQAELDKYTLAVSTLAEQQYEAQLKDIQSARDTEVAVLNAKGGNWLTKSIAPILAFFVSAIWGSTTVYLLLSILHLITINPSVNITSLVTFYASLIGLETIILSFYFGSSASSQKKDETISAIAQQS